jgi:hypothetical protein
MGDADGGIFKSTSEKLLALAQCLGGMFAPLRAVLASLGIDSAPAPFGLFVCHKSLRDFKSIGAVRVLVD